MPVGTHVTLRPRTGGLFSWSMVSEFGTDAINTISALAQLIACVGFYPWYSQYYIPACYVFFTTSVLSIVQGSHSLYEAMQNTKNISAGDDTQVGKHQREESEISLYLISSVLFAIGSILFLPDVYKIDEHKILTIGVWFFMIGSVFLACGVFVNSLSVGEVGSWFGQPQKNRLAICSCWYNNIGTALFLMGTPPYFPQLKGEGAEWDIGVFGTHLYVAGCVAYLLGALVNLHLVYLKHKDIAGYGKLVDKS